MAMIRPETEMKESGASWMGKIPCEWSVSKLKWYLRRIDPRNPGDKQVLSLYREYGVIPKDSRDDNHNATSEDTSKYKYVRVGDFVVNKMKAWQGSVAVSEYDGIVSPAYYVYHFTDDSYHRRYFHYLLRSCYKEEFMRLSGGIRVGQWDLSSKDLDNVLIVIPKKEEQQAIADYLDETCSKIDEIIAEAKASIDEYKELKQAVIFEAVTKGLDKNVEMKDSGVEWMGVIPKHWSTPKLKYFTNISSGGTPDRNHYEYWNGNVNWIKTGELQNNELYDSEEKISELGVANSSAKLFKENTILIAMYGQGKTRGMTALLKVPCTTNQACAGIVMKSNSPYEIYYLWLTLQASYRALREKAVGTGQPNLSIGLLKDFYIPLPTLQEQKEVINFLKKVMPKYDSLITEKESLINDLEAYKKSLIYEVVTGKRKVV